MAQIEATYKTSEAFLQALQQADAKPDVPMAAGLDFYKGTMPNGKETKFVVDTRNANPVYKQSWSI